MKNKEKASYVKEEIARAFFLLFEEKDFPEISIKEIIIKAQVIRVSFYRNFLSKEDILSYYFNQKMSEWRHTIDLIKSSNFQVVLATFSNIISNIVIFVFFFIKEVFHI